MVIALWQSVELRKIHERFSIYFMYLRADYSERALYSSGLHDPRSFQQQPRVLVQAVKDHCTPHTIDFNGQQFCTSLSGKLNQLSSFSQVEKKQRRI